jgi:hypothetical protein
MQAVDASKGKSSVLLLNAIVKWRILGNLYTPTIPCTGIATHSILGETPQLQQAVCQAGDTV